MNQDSMDIIKANQERREWIPLCPICGKQAVLICPDDLEKMREAPQGCGCKSGVRGKNCFDYHTKENK
jgi:hypothetical protein